MPKTEMPDKLSEVLPGEETPTIIPESTDEDPEQARKIIMQEMETKFDDLFLNWTKRQNELEIIERQKEILRPRKETIAEDPSVENHYGTKSSAEKKVRFGGKFKKFKETFRCWSDVKWLKKQGIKNPKQVIAFHDWCIDNIPYTQHARYFWNSSELERERSWLQKAIQAGENIRNIVEEDQTISWESRYQVEGRDRLRKYAELFKINPQADKIIRELNRQKLLCESDFTLKKEYGYSEDKDYLKQILEDPDIFRKLEILKNIDLSKRRTRNKGLSETSKILNNKIFLDFIKNSEEENSVALKEVVELAEKCLGNIDPEELIEIVTDKEKRELTKQIEDVISKENEGLYHWRFSMLIKNLLINEKNLGLVKQALQLNNVIAFGFLGWASRSSKEIEEGISRETQGLKLEEIINDPVKISWLQRFCGAFDRKLTLEEVGYINKKWGTETKENKYFWPTLGALMEVGLFKPKRITESNKFYAVKTFFHLYEELDTAYLRDSDNYQNRATVLEGKAESQKWLFDIGFIDFVKKFIKKTRIKTKIDFLPFLHRAYENGYRENLLTREGIAIQAYLKFKLGIGWERLKDYSTQAQEEFFDMVATPEMLETLRNLDKFFDYKSYYPVSYSGLTVWHKNNDKNNRKEFFDFLQQNQLVKKDKKIDIKHFYFLLDFFEFFKKESNCDIAGLRNGLTNNLCTFMSSQKDKIFSLAEEKRREIFSTWKKVSDQNITTHLKSKFFDLILDAENPNKTFEEAMMMLENEDSRLFFEENLEYFEKTLQIDAEKRGDYVTALILAENKDLSSGNKKLRKQIFDSCLESQNPLGHLNYFENLLSKFDENYQFLSEKTNPKIKNFVLDNFSILIEDFSDLEFLNDIVKIYGNNAEEIIKNYHKCLQAQVIDLNDKELINNYLEHLKIFSPEIIGDYKNSSNKQEFFDNINKIINRLSTSKSIDQEIQNNPAFKYYEVLLRHIYPQRNYNAYPYLRKYQDRTEDLTQYQFDKNGNVIKLSGILGYKLKAETEKDPAVLTEFEKRILQIQILARNNQWQKVLDEKLKNPQTQTYEGKLLELIFKKNGALTEEDLDLILAYQLQANIDNFIQDSGEKLQFAKDDPAKEYIELNALIREYGDSLKDTLKNIAEKVREHPEDRLLFQGSSEIDEIKLKIIDFSQKIVADLARIPSEKLTDKVIMKKVVTTLKPALQKQPRLAQKVDEFSKNFSIQDITSGQFEQKWQTEIQKFLEGNLPTTSLDVRPIQKLQERIYQGLKEELDKYEEIIEEDVIKDPQTGEKKTVLKKKKEREIRGYFSKTKENGLARMVADICIATDPDMWLKNNYFEYVLFDPERKKCVGTTMLLDIKDRGKKYLLYCPNPSTELVSKVSADQLYFRITKKIINFAKKNNFDGIVLDKTHGRSTNRPGLFQTALENSLLRDEEGRLISINLKDAHSLSVYSYQNNLNFVWKK